MNGNINQRARKTADEALNRLSVELEAGKSEALKNYLAAMSRFRRYSWNNILLISCQRPNATQVAGIHSWNELGRTVKKGEKAITILAPLVVKQEPVAGQEPPKEPHRVAGFRPAYVFDISQTQGKPLPEFAKTTGDPKDFTEKLKALAARQGIAVEYDQAIKPAQGLSSGGRIRLLPALEAAEEFSVLSHELAHEMLHHGKDAQGVSKVLRETEAEAVAYAVSQGIGLETNSASADYIKLYNGDKLTLARSLAAIREAATKILDELLPEERSHPATPNAEIPVWHSPSPSPEQGQPAQSSPGHHPTPSPEPVIWDR